MIRVAVLTSRMHGKASTCLPELAASQSIEIAAVLFAESPVSPNRRRLLRRKLKKVVKIGPLGALNGLRLRRWYAGRPVPPLDEVCRELGLPLTRVPFVNSDETVAAMSVAAPDIGLSLGNAYISKRVFSVPRWGMLNVHSERLPDYQNAQGVIWPIYNLERTTGLSVHLIDEKIDTGPLLHREILPIEFRPTLRETVCKTVSRVESQVPAAVRHVCENFEALHANASQQGAGHTYTTPSIWQFLRMVQNNRRLYRSRQREEDQLLV